MIQEKLHDEEALSEAEINRIRNARKRVIKKIFKIFGFLTLIMSIGYLLSLVEWKKMIEDRKKAKTADLIVVDPKLSHKFQDDDF